MPRYIAVVDSFGKRLQVVYDLACEGLYRFHEVPFMGKMQ